MVFITIICQGGVKLKFEIDPKSCWRTQALINLGVVDLSYGSGIYIPIPIPESASPCSIQSRTSAPL